MTTYKKNEIPIVVSYGVGTNSTAALVQLKNKGVRPDVITFADTAGEKPHTYTYLAMMQKWLASIGFPQIDIIQKRYRDGTIGTLYHHCVSRNMLPSLAYGYKNCSQKFKIEPQEKFGNNHPLLKAAWKAGDKVEKIIGYDADEDGRVAKSKAASDGDNKYVTRHPLHAEGMDRGDCLAVIKEAGLPTPGKSACFFCPASRLPEIATLKNTYPAMFELALRMEANAELKTVKGLGRRFAWKDADLTKFKGLKDWDADFDTDELDCGCYDG